MIPRWKQTLRLAYSLVGQLNDPRRWPKLPTELLRYAGDLRAFRAAATDSVLNGPLTMEPTLFQRAINSPFDAHYTYQSAWATKRIVESGVAEHVDVSSSVPFVAQLAGVLPVTMYEFHAPSIRLPGLTLKEASLLDLPMADQSVRSLSCLHVIEHVGLGRYGDPLDPRGTERALSSLARVLAPGGALYVSAPAGKARVAFNAHRVLDPRAVVAHMAAQGLTLAGFAFIDDAGSLCDPATPDEACDLWYGCGLYHFTRAEAS